MKILEKLTKCSLLLPLFVLALTVSLIGSSTAANAANGDNNTTNRINMGGIDFNQNIACPDTDLTTTWSQFYNETYTDTSTYNNYKQSWNIGYGGQYAGYGAIEQFAADWRTIKDSGNFSGYAVARYSYAGYDNTSPDFDQSLMGFRLFLIPSGTNATFGNGNVTFSQNVRSLGQWWNTGPGYCRMQTDDYNTTNTTYYDTRNMQFLLMNIDGTVTYNSDYTGKTIPASAGGTGGTDANQGVTKFDYYVAGKQITLANKTPDLRGDEQCRWYVNLNPAETYEEGDVANDVKISGDDTSCTKNITYTFADYGYFEVQLLVTYPHGLDGESAQTTWDAYKTLHIDGTTFSGGATIHGDAPITESLYENCEWADLGCHFRNFWVTLNSGFKSLFIPDGDHLRNLFDDTVEGAKTSLGFLLYPITFMQSVFGLIFNQGNNPVGHTCNIGAVSIFGSGATNMELCKWRDQFPQYFSFMQTFAQAGVAIGIIFMWSRKFKQFIGGESGEYGGDTDSIDNHPMLSGHSGRKYVGKSAKADRGL